MKALLICPAERSAVNALAESGPLALYTAFGQPLVAYWLEHLATLGVKEVRLLAADRPEQVRAYTGDGRRWGLRVEVMPELREPTPAEARAKYRRSDAPGWLAESADAPVMDHFPGMPDYPLFKSYPDCFNALRAWMSRAATNRLGVREASPGIWMGLRARVSPKAQLIAPCWIGANATVGPNSIIGPMAILEDRVMVEATVGISNSQIAPETFVGELTEVKDSFANGSSLANWRTGSAITVPDAFLMCSLGKRQRRRKVGNLLGRALAVLFMVLTFPIAIFPLLRAKLRNQPSLRPLVAVRPQLDGGPQKIETFVYYELADCTSRLRYWPQLWKIVRGDFAWVGNRPLSPAEVAELTNDFERLWLAAPIGIFSLAQAEGNADGFGDETRACSSFYAVQANWKMDLSILRRTLLAGAKKPSSS